VAVQSDAFRRALRTMLAQGLAACLDRLSVVGDASRQSATANPGDRMP